MSSANKKTSLSSSQADSKKSTPSATTTRKTVSVSKESSVGSKCCRCEEEVKDSDKAVSCETCDKWFHISCEAVTIDQYKFLTKDENKAVHWFCKDCEETTLNTGKIICALKTKQDFLEADIKNLKKELYGELMGVQQEMVYIKTVLASLEERLDKKVTLKEVSDLIENKLADHERCVLEKTKVEMQPSFAEIVASQVTSKFEKVSSDMTKVQQVLEETKKKADEEKDRESRSNNIIIYRVPEVEGDERIRSDKAFCTELAKDVLEIELLEDDIKSVIRLGEKGDYNRPLLVQFRERTTKNRIMECLFKLKTSDDKFRNISVTHDMTKQERSDCKALVEQAKQKQSEEKGEYLYRVRGLPGAMKVIKIHKK